LNFYKDREEEYCHELNGKELKRARVITIGGDLRNTQINPGESFTNYI